MKKIKLPTLAILASFFCLQSAFAKQSTKYPDMFDETESGSMFDETESGTGDWPSAAKMKAICDAPGDHKWRTVTVVRAGYDLKDPFALDFFKTDTLLGISTVNAYLNSARTEQLPCYRELITFSVEKVERTPRGSFARLNVTVDENTRVMSMNTSEEFVSTRNLYPYDYSTSGYYRDILRNELSLVPKSLMKLPAGQSTLKATLRIIPVHGKKPRVAHTIWEASGLSANETLYILNEINGSNVFTNSLMSSMTRTNFNGGAKTCTSIPERDLDAALRSGAGFEQLYTDFYDAQNPQSICSRSK